MDELDFDGLRADIEAATMLPEFDQVARRARRVRARGLLATASAVLAVFALLVPVGVVAARDRGTVADNMGPISGPDLTLPGPADPNSTPPTPSATTPPQVTIVAADGVDIAHVYALVDVCRGGACNLQLSQIRSGSAAATGPDKVGLLRAKPDDLLTGLRLEALSAKSLEISAMPATGGREYQRIDLGTMDDDARPGTVASNDRIGVVDKTGTLWAADAKSGALRKLAKQPPIGGLNVVSTAPANGLWVTGTDPVTGHLAVSVSRDAGHHWTTVGLGVMTDGSTPALATYQGQTAYLLTRTADGDFALFRTRDGGVSWQRLSTPLPWQARADTGTDTGYGLIVRPDGSLLAWLGTNPGPSYALSTDHGLTFSNTTGPGGPVIAVSNGYVSLGAPPKLSSDGSNWVTATVPTLNIT